MIAIDGCDHAAFCESSLPLDDRPIAAGWSRWVLIAPRRKCVDFDRSLDFDPTIAM